VEQTPALTATLVAAGYACGLLPTGTWLARRRGIDVRQSGSGNPGATNVLRTAGVGAGVATLAGDVAKAAIPTWIASALFGDIALTAAVGVAAMIGHCFPITAGFQGGKGVASALGVLLVAAPHAALAAVLAFTLAVAVTRTVSVGSLAAAVVAPATLVVIGSPAAVVGATALMSTIVWFRHAPNLRRLLAGTEPRLRALKRQASA
jgi:acyl phosphate:glycerol-3-phosphate acyltransferase